MLVSSYKHLVEKNYEKKKNLLSKIKRFIMHIQKLLKIVQFNKCMNTGEGESLLMLLVEPNLDANRMRIFQVALKLKWRLYYSNMCQFL